MIYLIYYNKSTINWIDIKNKTLHFQVKLERKRQEKLKKIHIEIRIVCKKYNFVFITI